jgi:hypothetical protein
MKGRRLQPLQWATESYLPVPPTVIRSSLIVGITAPMAEHGNGNSYLYVITFGRDAEA